LIWQFGKFLEKWFERNGEAMDLVASAENIIGRYACIPTERRIQIIEISLPRQAVEVIVKKM